MQNIQSTHPFIMMRILFIISLLFSFKLTAQLQKTKIDFDKMSPTITWEQKDSIYLDLPILTNSLHKNHWRIYLNGQTIDFISEDNINYKAILTNDITEYRDEEESKRRYKYIFEKIEFDTLTSTKVANKIIASGQLEIPTDSLIPEWRRFFFDCSGVSFQYRLDTVYFTKYYTCLRGQATNTPFLNVVENNIGILEEAFKLDSHYNVFTSKLESGKVYSKDGFMFLSILEPIKPSKKVLRFYSKKQYFDSIIDSIDNFILSKFEPSKIKNEYCNMEYHIIYSKKGKLKKVKIQKDYKAKLSDGLDFYLEDLKTNRRCKKIMKKILKEIDLSKFNFKYPFDRIVDVSSNGNITLHDYTPW